MVAMEFFIPQPSAAIEAPARLDPGGVPPRNPFQIAHRDYYQISNGVVCYTQAGLLFYTSIFKKKGLPLPLPADAAAFRDILWCLADELVAEATGELQVQLPHMAAAEADLARGWLSADPALRASTVNAIASAHADHLRLQGQGANVASLALARLRRHSK